MKNLILTLVIIAFVSTSCNQKKNEDSKENTTATATQDTTQLYSCPMHPEITGEKGAICSECGMKLSEAVTATDNE